MTGVNRNRDSQVKITMSYLVTAVTLVGMLSMLAGCQRTDTQQPKSTHTEQTPIVNPLSTTSTANPVVASTPKPTVNLTIAAASSLKFVLPILMNDFNRTHPTIHMTAYYDSAVNLYETMGSKTQDFDIFLSSNQALPKLMYEESTNNRALRKYGKPFTYARGQLVLYSNQHPLAATPTGTLDDFILEQPTIKLVIANPQVSPYGTAAENWLLTQNLASKVEHNISYQPSVDDAFDAVSKQQADFGFVALSQVINTQPSTNTQTLSQTIATQQFNYAILPKDSYPPIFQDGIVLKSSEASEQFVEYLLTAKAQDVLTDAGYLPVCVSSNLLPACK